LISAASLSAVYLALPAAMALALLMSSSVSGVEMTGFLTLVALEAVVVLVLVLVALVILGFLVGGAVVSLSESAVGEELLGVAEEEVGEWGCLLFLETVGFLLVLLARVACEMLEMGGMNVVVSQYVREGAMVRDYNKELNLPVSSPAVLRSLFLMSWKQARADWPFL
jgi:hypothetical protein